MATPTGPRADSARSWFARERRRKKQDQKDFEIAGHTPATPFDLGSAAPLAAFTNGFVLPANAVFQVIVTTPSAALPAGALTFTDGIETAANRQDLAELQTLNAFFGESRTLAITRDATVATGTLEVYFFGPKTQRILVATGSLT